MWAALEEEATTLEREEVGRKEREEDAMESMLRTWVDESRTSDRCAKCRGSDPERAWNFTSAPPFTGALKCVLRE
jgi:hypothetical protein